VGGQNQRHLPLHVLLEEGKQAADSHACRSRSGAPKKTRGKRKRKLVSKPKTPPRLPCAGLARHPSLCCGTGALRVVSLGFTDRCYTPRGLPRLHERCYSPSSVVVPRRARRRSTACPSSVGVPVPRRRRARPPSSSPRAPSVVVVPRRARRRRRRARPPSSSSLGVPSVVVAARALRRRRPSACPSLGVPVVLARARLLASRFCETFPNAFQYAF